MCRNIKSEEECSNEPKRSLLGAEQNQRVDVVYQPLSVRCGQCDDYHRETSPQQGSGWTAGRVRGRKQKGCRGFSCGRASWTVVKIHAGARTLGTSYRQGKGRHGLQSRCRRGCQQDLGVQAKTSGQSPRGGCVLSKVRR